MNVESLLQTIAARILTDEELRRAFASPLGITVNGEKSRSWLISSELVEVSKEKAAASSLSVEVAEKDLFDLVEGEANPQALFIQGRLKVKGDITLAFKLHRAFGSVRS